MMAQLRKTEFLFELGIEPLKLAIWYSVTDWQNDYWLTDFPRVKKNLLSS